MGYHGANYPKNTSTRPSQPIFSRELPIRLIRLSRMLCQKSRKFLNIGSNTFGQGALHLAQSLVATITIELSSCEHP